MPPLHPVEANCVFVQMNQSMRDALSEQGFGLFLWDGRPDAVQDETRFVCSFLTTDDDVKALLAAVQELM